MPGSSCWRAFRIAATPSCTAVCTSCPHACMTPTSCPRYMVRRVDRNGTSVSSVTGRASMSARTATTGPGCSPRRTATTPVWGDAGPDVIETDRA